MREYARAEKNRSAGRRAGPAPIPTANQSNQGEDNA